MEDDDSDTEMADYGTDFKVSQTNAGRQADGTRAADQERRRGISSYEAATGGKAQKAAGAGAGRPHNALT